MVVVNAFLNPRQWTRSDRNLWISRVAVVLFFMAYILIGLALYGDYGMSLDEPFSRANGLVNFRHIATIFAPSWLTEATAHYPDLSSWTDKDYGVAFEVPAVAIEQFLGLRDSRDIYQFRHLLTFLSSSLGALATFGIARNRFGRNWTGLAAAAMFILSPRLFAESFYNSKDMVFLSAFAVAAYTMIRFAQGPGWVWAILHGTSTAIAIDVRLMALLIPLCTIEYLALQVTVKRVTAQQAAWAGILYLLFTGLMVIALFPHLWENPIANFIGAVGNMARFRWTGTVLYLGTLLDATNLPWHYVPVWMVITTPPVYLFFFLVGVWIMAYRLCAKGIRRAWGDLETQDFIVLQLIVVPILAIIILKSVLYDGWRQMYFVYVPFVLIAIHGLAGLAGQPGSPIWRRLPAFALLGFAFCANVNWMWHAHPLQNVYFNFLAGKDWKSRFDLDYWGLGNRMAFEYILAHDTRTGITIIPASYNPLDRTLLILDPENRGRISIGNPDQRPLYVIDNYRLAIGSSDEKYGKDYNVFYNTTIDGERILTVYRLKDVSSVTPAK